MREHIKKLWQLAVSRLQRVLKLLSNPSSLDRAPAFLGALTIALVGTGSVSVPLDDVLGFLLDAVWGVLETSQARRDRFRVRVGLMN